MVREYSYYYVLCYDTILSVDLPDCNVVTLSQIIS